MRCSRYARWTVAVAMILVLPALALASGQPEGEPEDLTLEVLFRTFTAHEPESEVEHEFERILGFDIEFDARPALEYVQTTQAVLASGDYPDLMEVWFADAEKEISALAEDGVIVALDELLDQYGPSVYEARPFEGNWYRPLPDGKTYNMKARFNTYGFEYGWIVRQDWLDNLGLQVPENLDEFREVARALTEDDPDGDGNDNTYGVSSGYPAQARASMFRYVLSATGVMFGHWQDVDGHLTNWVVNPGTLDALKYMRELYLAGYIDPEFALQQRPAWLENMRDGRYGMQFWWNTHLDANASEWWAEFQRRQPGAEISFIPPAPDPNGEMRIPGNGVKGYSPSLVIFADAPEANQVAAMQFVNLLASEDGAMLGAFGIEGEHWDMEDGTVVSYVSGSEEQAAAGTYRFGWIFRRTNVIPTNNLVRENLNFYEDYVTRPVCEETVPAQTEFSGVLNELVQSRFLRIQTEPGIDVDAEWDDFVELWMDSGGAAWTEQMNEACVLR